MNHQLLLLILIVSAGIQSEGGKITQANINFSHDFYFSGNYIYDVLIINNNYIFITTEIPKNVQNPFIDDGFLYYEIV